MKKIGAWFFHRRWSVANATNLIVLFSGLVAIQVWKPDADTAIVQTVFYRGFVMYSAVSVFGVIFAIPMIVARAFIAPLTLKIATGTALMVLLVLSTATSVLFALSGPPGSTAEIPTHIIAGPAALWLSFAGSMLVRSDTSENGQ
ncbi:MAG: hypothetical protein KAU31_17035 [Spirochaetaceae bacterium]|nr:hypothetical protein [Spirochaetaceae bacterium]